MALDALVALVEQPLEHLVAVAAHSGLVEGSHHGLVGGGEALGRDLVVVRHLDGLDPLVLVVLGPGEHRVGVQVLLVDQHEAVGPPGVPRQPPRGDILHFVILDLQSLFEAVVISPGETLLKFFLYSGS